MKTKSASALKSAIAGSLLLGGMGVANAAEISGNVTLASDYSFRGVSQTDRDPAIQGGFDVAFDNGFYVGTWSSNVSFGTTSQELDLYGGYSGQINENVSFDVNYVRFEYPGDGSNLDYNEFGGSLSFSDFTVGVIYSPEYFAIDDVTWFYPYAEYSLSLPRDASLDFHVGWSAVDDNSAGDWVAAFGDEDVIDYSVTYTIPVMGVDFGIGIVGTDADGSDGCDKFCELRPIVSLSKSL
ncbi:MAG: TorF family putative porin [Pseudomonadales bacterium]